MLSSLCATAGSALRATIAAQDAERRAHSPTPPLVAPTPPASPVTGARNTRADACRGRAERLARVDTALQSVEFPHRREAKLFFTPEQFSRPLTPEERRALSVTARSHARNTQTSTMPFGVLPQKVRDVLDALIKFMDEKTGACFPSYTALQKRAGCCRQTVARALKILEGLGYIDRTRRLVRETLTTVSRHTGLAAIVTIVRQGTNLYRLNPRPCTSTVLRADALDKTRAQTARRRAGIASLAEFHPYDAALQIAAMITGLLAKRV